MKYLLCILLLLLMVGCVSKIKCPIVISEIKHIGDGKCIYHIQRHSGWDNPYFITECGTYNIGDTIK